MTDFADFTTQIAEYANRQDWSSVVVTGFVRQAEEIFNRDLRIDRMLQADDALIASAARPCLMIGSRWTWCGSPSPRRPITPRALRRSSTSRGPSSSPLRTNAQLAFTPSRAGRSSSAACLTASKDRRFRIDYYQEVPVFSDTTPSYIYTKYPGLYLNTALYRAALHAVGEEQTAANYKQMSDETIQKLNAAHRYSRASGSRLSRTRTRSFG